MKENLKSHLSEVVNLLDNNQSVSQVLKSNRPTEIKSTLNKTLNSEGISFNQLLSDLEKEILPYINRNTDPRFAAYITGSGNPIGAIAEFIKGYYNQNGLKWNNSPIANELEQLVIRWVAEFVGLPDHSSGLLTSGGSMSNYLGLHFALAAKFPQREMDGLMGAKGLTVYCSNQSHSSIERSMVFLGLGRSNLRKIDVDCEFKIDVNKLRSQLIEDIESGLQPLAIIGNAGTTNVGAIDDLEKLAQIAKEFNTWYHVDGAYGLPARNLLELSSKFDGIEHANSIIINPHKWMYVPFEASCILLKQIPKAIHFEPDYLYTANKEDRWESSEHTIELTKEFRALKVWFTMKFYGTNKLIEFIRHDIEMTNYLASKLEKVKYFVVERVHPLSILCFRYENDNLTEEQNEITNQKALLKIENEGLIFITGTKLHGKTYMRAYFGNPDRTKKDVDYMVGEILASIKQ
ncbi:MAG: pyridoxal-dependent decarboxylase [Fulvivirga sp.]|uniref:pyridoxal phosphate-dependent decarboxylase family protein n=1 Tax=Fulvivirga sp. TaxID=1931237 RepID=UPI0032EC02C8